MTKPATETPRSPRDEVSLFEEWMGISEEEWEALGNDETGE